MPNDDSTNGSPFHAGELEAQQRVGARQRLAPFASRAIRSHLPEQHRTFFEELQFLVLCALDAEGTPQLTSLSGAPGFVSSPTPEELVIHRLPDVGDPLEDLLKIGSDIGILGIIPAARRRNRMNGVIAEVSEHGLRAKVVQSFGNCKQYITERQFVLAPPQDSEPEESPALGSGAHTMIEQADTFFIGSGAPDVGLDASHRGGPPGFVTVHSPEQLSFVDYAGNNFFNTVGNLSIDPRVALLFVDFQRGNLLHLSGRAEVEWLSKRATEEASVQRLIHVTVSRAVFRRGAFGLSTSSPRD